MEVDQCDWGHLAQKRTWLYIVGVDPIDMPDVPPPKVASHVMVRLRSNSCTRPEVPKHLRHLTPMAFALWLVKVARCVVRP